LRTIRTSLKFFGPEAQKFETRLAATGEEGLAASLDKDRPPLLILLDQLLPEMSGLEICRRIRRAPATSHSHKPHIRE
jgi:two-component system, OmpR family, phosphate regulon response regulator PhoB